MSNVKLYSDTSKNIKKAAVKVDSYVVKKLMNNNPSEMGSLIGSGDNVHLPAISIEDEKEINEDIQM